MIDILIMLVIALVVFVVAKYVVAEFGFPPNIVRIIYLVMGLIFFLFVLNWLGLSSFSLR